jgi:predicted ferric reductase
MLVAAATVTSNSRALWYLTRGFGLVALILLTVTMVLGLTQAVRFARPGWPRFVVSALHKNASLVALVLLVIHIVTSLLDTYAPIRIVDVFIPFVSQYRPVWLGLGALSLDLLIAVLVTSLLRERLGHRAWRAVHWAAFACWPLGQAPPVAAPRCWPASPCPSQSWHGRQPDLCGQDGLAKRERLRP